MKKKNVKILLGLSVCALASCQGGSIEEITYSSSDIRFAESVYAMDLHDTMDLHIANADLEQIVTWSSSNENVVTVSSRGVLSSLSVGSATISASFGDLSSQCEITVYDSFSFPTIKLSQTDLNLYVGDKSELTAMVINRGKTIEGAMVTWSVEDKTLLSLDTQGNEVTINALNEGETRIFASYDYYGQTATSSCLVKIVENDIYFNVLNASPEEGGYYVRLNAGMDFIPNVEVSVNGKIDESAYLLYSSSNTDLLKVEDGVIKAIHSGEAYAYGNYRNAATLKIRFVIA